MKKQALGRGLNALLGGGSSDGAAGERVSLICPSLIRPNALQPRQHFAADSLQELASSIQANGVLQPLIVRRSGNGFELIAGERRLQAARLAGLTTVPVIVKDADDQQMLVFALLENLQREDLTPTEEARALRRLSQQFHLSHDAIGQLIGKSRSHVSNMLRLLSLPAPLVTLIEQGQLSVGHAKVLAGVSSAEQAIEIAEFIVERNLTVRQTEDLINHAQAKASLADLRNAHETSCDRERKQTVPLTPHLQDVELRLQSSLGLPVRILKGKRKGRVEIGFSTSDDLDVLLKRLSDAS